MDLELRSVRDDEMKRFGRAVLTGFGNTVPDPDNEYPDDLLRADRALVACDDDRIVATAGAYDFRVTVPGGAQLPVAGVTCVTVHPTHRRRGILRQLMAEQLDDVAARGEALAALTASESSIYERFGYGAATFTTRWEIESTHAVLDPPASRTGRVRFTSGADAVAVAQEVYDRAAAERVGELARPESWWPRLFTRPDAARRGFAVVHEGADGTPDAFARYRMEHRWADGVSADVLHLRELHGVDPTAEAELWSYLFGIDLVATVTADDRPVDDPLRWRLPDARRLRVRQLRDHLWVRVLDVATALAGRTYGCEDALVLELHDEFRPGNSGGWLLDGSSAGASCARTDRPADLALGAADLGSLLLGGVPASTLAAAGRVRELTTGAVARADRLLLVHPSPWCTTHF
jgi:predicted acetyltransferase